MRIEEAAAVLVAKLKEHKMTLATAESCTGGGVGRAVTAVPGSSAVYLGGVISYSNDVKTRVLGVPEGLLKAHGAVSQQTAVAMARGARALIEADIAVSITGIAGPASDDTQKPVGLVYVSTCTGEKCTVEECHFTGSREAVREQSILKAITMLIENIE